MTDKLSRLERAQKVVDGELPYTPIAELLGFKLVSVEYGQAITALDVSEKHGNTMGTLHGGVLCDIADAAMGMAFATTLEIGESFATVELKINFLKPVWNAKLRAIGKVIKSGRTIGLLSCDVIDEDDTLIAHATCTCIRLVGQQADGR